MCQRLYTVANSSSKLWRHAERPHNGFLTQQPKSCRRAEWTFRGLNAEWLLCCTAHSTHRTEGYADVFLIIIRDHALVWIRLTVSVVIPAQSFFVVAES